MTVRREPQMRVVVYEGRSLRRTKEIAQRLRDVVDAFDGKRGDIYLLIGYEETNPGWRWVFWKIVVNGPGTRSTFERL